MKIIYKLVNTRTLDGLREAERLNAAGWTMGSVGLETIQFYRSAAVFSVDRYEQNRMALHLCAQYQKGERS